MLMELVNRLRGQVWLRAECAFPERVLNVCSARNLAFWDLEWESDTAFRCRVSRQDYHRLRLAAEQLDCTLTVVGREGAPFFLLRLRRRPVLMAGLIGCALALFLGSFFIWDFQVEGNETVPEEAILRSLERHGVKLGTFGLSLDGEDLRNHVLLDIPQLCWIAVNVSGCRAQVQVRERIVPPQLLDERSPANVVAREAGLVLKVGATEGVACVLPGTAVTKGQLLISGVEDTGTVGERMMPGMGSVQARTWHTLTTEIPLAVQEKQYTGSERTLVSAVFGKQRVKFFSNSSIEGRKYDKITKEYRGSLLGIPLPLRIETETCRFYETEQAVLEPAAAERLGEEILQEQLQRMVAPHGTITSTLCSSHQQDGVLTVTLSAECVEEIGLRVPILTEEPGDGP